MSESRRGPTIDRDAERSRAAAHPGTPVFFHRSKRGSARIWLAAPGVLVFEQHGHAALSQADFLDRTARELFGEGREGRRFDLFIDAEELTGYDVDFRTAATAWGRRMEPQIAAHCIFVRSRLVALGIAVAALPFRRPASVVWKRSAFSARLNAAIRRAAGAEN